MEIPEGNHNPLEDEVEGHLKGEQEFYNRFHNIAGDGGHPNRNGLEEQLVCALDLSGGGSKIKVSDCFGQMHAKDSI